jgi:hypothetical protein
MVLTTQLHPLVANTKNVFNRIVTTIFTVRDGVNQWRLGIIGQVHGVLEEELDDVIAVVVGVVVSRSKAANGHDVFDVQNGFTFTRVSRIVLLITQVLENLLTLQSRSVCLRSFD